MPRGSFVAANYRPAGMNPAVAKTQEKILHCDEQRDCVVHRRLAK